MPYAEGTSVSVDKSRAEIESTITRFGADQFTSGHDFTQGVAVIQFRAHGRHVRFRLELPNRDDKRFRFSKRGQRTEAAAYAAWEQACREKWRALAICVKAKLAAVEARITTFEDEFLAHVVIPGGATAGEWLRPQIAEAYETGKMPQTLLGLPAPAKE